MKQYKGTLAAWALALLFLAGCSQTQAPTGQSDNGGESAPQAEAGTDQVEQTTPEEEAAEEQEITLYLPNDQGDAFEEAKETVLLQPQNIVDALTGHGVLPQGVTVNTFEVDEEGNLQMDVSQEFAVGLGSTGTTGEAMMLGSLVNTLLSAYQAETVAITCGGETLETGHNVYDTPLSFSQLP